MSSGWKTLIPQPHTYVRLCSFLIILGNQVLILANPMSDIGCQMDNRDQNTYYQILILANPMSDIGCQMENRDQKNRNFFLTDKSTLIQS